VDHPAVEVGLQPQPADPLVVGQQLGDGGLEVFVAQPAAMR
jgi:hypothetical protein